MGKRSCREAVLLFICHRLHPCDRLWIGEVEDWVGFDGDAERLEVQCCLTLALFYGRWCRCFASDSPILAEL